MVCMNVCNPMHKCQSRKETFWRNHILPFSCKAKKEKARILLYDAPMMMLLPHLLLDVHHSKDASYSLFLPNRLVGTVLSVRSYFVVLGKSS